MDIPRPENAPECSSPQRHWPASLTLKFAATTQRTELVHSRHDGPLRVQRLFHPEAGGRAHCYLLHPPGGVVLGDELTIDVSLISGSALLTTPSAGRFYSIGEHSQSQTQRVSLRAQGGTLAWLPQETLLFSGSNARLHTRIDLAGTAQLVYWDVLVLGRPASGERFSAGQAAQQLDVYRDGRPLLCERLALRAGDVYSRSRLGLADSSTAGIMLFSGEVSTGLLEDWLEQTASAQAGPFTVTRRDGLCIARYRGECAAECRAGFSALWLLLERDAWGTDPAVPRIWHT